MSRLGATGALRVAAVGFFVAVAVFVAILCLTFGAFAAMQAARLADFRYSGVGWPALYVVVFQVLFLPPYLIALFAIVIPLLFARASERGAALPRTAPLAIASVIAVAAGIVAFPEMAAVAAAGPTVLVTLLAGALFIGRLNARLANANKPLPAT